MHRFITQLCDLDKENLYGLALCGGKSSRMGKDKSLLNYHGKAQCYHVYELLQHFCANTFISCNSSQTAAIDSNYKILEDLPLYADAGPATAVLTAFSSYPRQQFLVIGCDYPFLSEAEIRHFLAKIKTGSIAAAFYDEQEQYYQPVLAWYSSQAGALLQESFQKKEYALQQFLKKINAGKHYPLNPASMLSIDTMESSEEAKRHITNYNP